ncbi:MAG TPA: biopolymer transporter ExbD [Verrucomicrobiales bacterium]|nr:biopolymer transporter ExbD [Verrucomicrobiales bacterium]
MNIPSPRVNRRARIEIIPLIDIIFFLLATFVMVSLAMVRQNGIAVQLPAASTATSPPEPDVTLTVAAGGLLFWNKEAVTAPQMRSRLAALSASQPEARISVNGDEDARLGAAIDVLDAARAAGLARVSFQTRPLARPNTP